MNRIEIQQNIGNKVILDGRGDLGMDGDLRPLIYNKTPLTIIGLTKGGKAYLREDIISTEMVHGVIPRSTKIKYYSVPPRNVNLIEVLTPAAPTTEETIKGVGYSDLANRISDIIHETLYIENVPYSMDDGDRQINTESREDAAAKIVALLKDLKILE